jgi:hypothetical protein
LLGQQLCEGKIDIGATEIDSVAKFFDERFQGILLWRQPSSAAKWSIIASETPAATVLIRLALTIPDKPSAKSRRV